MRQSLVLLLVFLGVYRSAFAQDKWNPRDDWQGKDRSKLTSEAPSSTQDLGDFTIRWNAEVGQLTIERSSSSKTLSLWQSLPGQVFVLAGRGRESVWEARGSFAIKDWADGIKCREQTVERVESDGKILRILGQIKGPGCLLRYGLSFQAASAKRLQFDLQILETDAVRKATAINRTYLAFASSPSESFFGFGEQFTDLNLKGRVLPILASEQGHFRGVQPYTAVLNSVAKGVAGDWSTTYTAIPFYLTNKNNGLFLENSAYSVFDLSHPESVEITTWDQHLRGQILSGDKPLDIVEAFTEYSGRMQPLPRWFHQGAIIGLMGGSQKARDMWRLMKSYDVPISAFWFQDWQGARDTLIGKRLWWNWELDRKLYPDWEELLGDLKAEGIATLGYINPFLSDSTKNPEQKRNLFAEARDLGYLVLNKKNKPYETDSGGFKGTLVDLTNPDAFAWYKDVIKQQLLGIGMKGWMADFGEALPFDAKIAHGDAAKIHNVYPELWAEVNRQAIVEAGLSGDAVAFLRSAGTKSAGKVSLFWLGDQMTTWDEDDGMKSAIKGLLSGGISGLSINHADMGGYVSMQQKVAGLPLIDITRSKDLMLRGIEMSAFTSVFRNHEGVNPDLNHQIYSDPSTLEFYAYFAKIYSYLADYREELFEQAATLGHPVARHLLLEFPDDAMAWQIKDQWMLGQDFLIAPVTDPGTSRKRLYVPAGDWVHLWTGENVVSNGQWLDISAPFGQPPVFYLKASIRGQELRSRVLQLPFKPTAQELQSKS